MKPNLTLVVRAWRHLCEVEVIQTATDHLILIGEMDHKPFERIVRINPGLLRSELEDWYTLQRIPETIYDVAGNPIDPATWYYPELRSAADEGMQSLRRSHEDQSNRLQRVVEAHAGWNKAVLVGLGIVALGMLTTIVVLLLK